MPTLTLLTTTGTVHHTGGLNWGSNSKNHTTPLDAYIPIHIAVIRRNLTFFSPKKTVQDILTLTWDDGEVMQGLFEGSQPDLKTGLIYPKQISSTPAKNTMGCYFRKRLGVSPIHRITMEDLQKYGRTSIDITNTGPNQYHVDFGV